MSKSFKTIYQATVEDIQRTFDKCDHSDFSCGVALGLGYALGAVARLKDAHEHEIRMERAAIDNLVERTVRKEYEDVD